MVITPQSQVFLCDVPLEDDYKNTFLFTTPTIQRNYFNSTIVTSFTEYTYLRKDNVIKVQTNIDNIINCNYLFYTNIGFSNKTYYCFIKNMEYVSENSTAITIETDVMQTWLFDIEYHPTFIEREHVNIDTIGLHTIPEGLEHGEYVVKNQYPMPLATAHPVITASWNLDSRDMGATIMNNIYQASVYILPKKIQDMITILQYYDSQAKADSIISVYMVPDTLTNYNTRNFAQNIIKSDGTLLPCEYSLLSQGDINLIMEPFSIPKNYNDINGYIPKNNKLFTKDYNYFFLTNNNGNSNTYYYELFSTNNCIMNLRGAISEGCEIRCYPTYYKNTIDNHEEGLNLGKYPVCSWITDSYTNWLTQTSVNRNIQALSSLVSVGTNLATDNYAGLVGDVQGIFNQMATQYEHALVPPSAKGNTNCGDVVYAMNNNTFTAYQMTIKREYAIIIDRYLSKYGYKVNDIKFPNIRGRRYFNYVKTIGCDFTGNINQDDMNKIRNIFDTGITFWHNTNVYLNYNVDNSIN